MSAFVRATIPGWQAFRTTIMIPEALWTYLQTVPAMAKGSR
jgi:hypothetical protein